MRDQFRVLGYADRRRSALAVISRGIAGLTELSAPVPGGRCCLGWLEGSGEQVAGRQAAVGPPFLGDGEDLLLRGEMVELIGGLDGLAKREVTSISARTPYSADRSRRPVSTVCAPCRCDTSAGKADRTVAPRWPLIRIVYRAGAGSMTSWSGAGR